MARKPFRDDGQGNPVGKINVNMRIDDYRWFMKRRRVDKEGKLEPLYSTIWHFRELFEASDIHEINEQYEQARRNCNAMQARIKELEAEVAELKKPRLGVEA
jgi:hypothetical protein